MESLLVFYIILALIFLILGLVLFIIGVKRYTKPTSIYEEKQGNIMMIVGATFLGLSVVAILEIIGMIY
jgi:TRAP-type C4-dicarboxylate transport system permease small subunit